VALTGVLMVAAALATSGVIYLDVRASDHYGIADQARARQVQLATLEAAMNDRQACLVGFVATGDPGFLLPEAGDPDIPGLLASVRAHSPAGDQASLQTLSVAIGTWLGWADAKQSSMLAGAPPAEPASSLRGKALFDGFMAAYLTVQSEANRDAVGALSMAQAENGQQAVGTLFAAIICVGLLLVLVALFMRSTLSPLRSLVHTATALAAAEPTDIPGLARRDEVGDLARALGRWRAGEEHRLLLSTAMVEMSLEDDPLRILQASVPRLLALFSARQVLISLVQDGAPIVALSEPAAVLSPGDELAIGSPGRRALALGRPVVSDLRRDDWDPGLQRWGLGPVLAMPLISGGRTLGVATVLRGFEDPGFEDADLHQAEVAAPFVAAAVNAASLFQHVEAANADLELASRLKSEFLANMTHELRTPLNSILGFSELLLRSLQPGGSRERDLRYVGNIQTSGKHLLELVSELLDLSMIDAGKIEIDRTTVSLTEVVETALASVEPLAAVSGQRLTVEVEAGARALADPNRLQQVLFKLLSNAIKFNPPGGEVAVSATADAERAVIRVRDGGPGIRAEDQERIFDRFEQLAGGTNRAARGTGLGLALSKALVELQGGSIGVESEPGKGATFIVKLVSAPRPAVTEARLLTAGARGPAISPIRE
jgi:signal transduction histidine kinase/HAMP domain-containing protein